MGPVSTVYAEALDRYTRDDVAGGRAMNQRYSDLDAARENLRDEFAELLTCDREHLFLTQSTSNGLRAIIETISWQPGDEVISTDLEHEACALPLRRQAELSGLKIRIARISGSDDLVLDSIASQITDRTRLMAFSGTAFESGRRLPTRRIVELARKAGVPTLLDAAQSAGAVPLDLDASGIDYCALPMQKWLCGPEGLGALYVRRESAHALTASPRDSVVHGHGIVAASAEQLRWLRQTLGWDWIHQRTAELTAYARAAVETSGFATLITPSACAGLTTLTFAGATAPALAEDVAERGFIVRHLAPHAAFRISTAFFNTENEIDELLTVFAELSRQQERAALR
jgi:L-cysteine/cystine lyase